MGPEFAPLPPQPCPTRPKNKKTKKPGLNRVNLHKVNYVCRCRISSLIKPRMTQPFVLSTKETSIWVSVSDVSDGSSPSVALSAADHCLLMQHCE